MKTKQPQTPVFILPCLLAVALLFSVTAPAADQYGVPNYIDYQGKLLDDTGTPLANGDTAALYDIEFRLWDQSEGGTVIWAERQLVAVLKGQFSVRLGEGTAITGAGNADIGLVGHDSPGLAGAFLGNQRYLGIKINSGTAPAEISPRLSFLSVPFAMVAQTATKLVQADGTYSQLRVGSVAYSTATLTQDLTLSGDERTNLIDGAAALINVTLPLSGANKELLIAKKDSSTNQVVVNPPVNGTINGGTSPIRLKVKGESTTLQNLGGNDWWVVNENRDKTPVGTIIAFGGNGDAPAGYIVCDGRSLNRADHPELFAAIGTQWGALSGTTFSLPTSAGRFLRGIDSNSDGADDDAANRIALLTGGATGRNVGSYQNEDFKSHTHTSIMGAAGAHTHDIVQAPGGEAVTNAATAGGWGLLRRSIAGEAVTSQISDTAGSGTQPDITKGPLPVMNSTEPDHTHTLTINASGGTETRPDNMGVRFVIKY